MNILALLTDAYGGHGGIALYNRDMLAALCDFPDCEKIVAIPRIIPLPCQPIPEKISYITSGINSKIKFLTSVLGATLRHREDIDLIICGHINLVPIAYLAKKILNAPILLEIYGIDAWRPSKNTLSNRLIKQVDAVVSISQVTKERFCNWSKIENQKVFLLPNAIHQELYGIKDRNKALVEKYKLNGHKVLMTLGRIVSADRFKGFDEIIDLIPDLNGHIPPFKYIIAGDGRDRPRLEEKVKTLGIQGQVIFTGYVSEEEKPDHYRLADAYVMPGRSEGFGFVFLEALACGVPVVGSKIDGSREALRNGELGILVDPRDPSDIKAGILQVLETSKKEIPLGLSYFSFENFTNRLHRILDAVMDAKANCA